MNTVFAGVDIECSGSDPSSSLIQIGVAVSGGTFVSDVLPFKPLNITAEALKVNKFTIERILRAPGVAQVDAKLCEWLDLNILTSNALLMPVGWNVGSFDMPFVREAFPHAMRWFHKYRSVDLNAICFLLGGADKWENVKKAAKRHVAEILKSENWHDAGYDAEASLLAFHYFQGRVQQGPIG